MTALLGALLSLLLAGLLACYAFARARKQAEMLVQLSEQTKALEKTVEDLRATSGEADKRGESAITLIEKRSEIRETHRRELDKQWMRSIVSTKEKCAAQNLKVNGYLEQIRQQLDKMQSANGHRDSMIQFAAVERGQARARELELERKVEDLEKVSHTTQEHYQRIIEWTMTDKLLQLSGEHDAARDKTAAIVDRLGAHDLFTSLAVSFPSALAIDVLESFEPKQKYRQAILDAAHVLAEKTFHQERYREAKIWYRRALELNAQVAQPSEELLSNCLFQLSQLGKLTDDRIACLRLFEEIMENRTVLCRVDSVRYAAALCDLATTFESYADAEMIIQSRRRVHEAYLSSNRSECIDAADNLARLSERLLKVGRYEESVPIGMKALAIYKQHVPPKDARIQDALLALARCFFRMGRLQRATDIYACLCAANVKLEAMDRAQVSLRELEEVAHEYRQEKRWEKAEQTFAICQRHYERIDLDHPGVMRQLRNLASLHKEHGNDAAQIEVLEDIRSRIKQSPKHGRDEVLAITQELVDLYARTDRWAQEEPALVETVRYVERQEPRQTILILSLKERLAERRVAHALYAEAEKDYLEILALRSKQPDGPDPSLARTYAALGNARLLQRDFAGAETAFTGELAVLNALYGTDHIACIEPMMNLGKTYIAAQQVEDARRCYKRIHELRLQHLGAHHEDTTTALLNLAELERTQGKFNEAAAYFDQALVGATGVPGASERIATVLERFAEMEAERGNKARAQSLRARATRIRTPKQSDTVNSQLVNSTIGSSQQSMRW